MLNPTRVAAAILIVLIVALAFWSKLRFVDETTEGPQRWRIEEHPRFSE